jgi:hypothetical protein
LARHFITKSISSGVTSGRSGLNGGGADRAWATRVC